VSTPRRANATPVAPLRAQSIIDRQTEPWGIKVGTVELKDAQLAESMVRALARQAEAEREKRAKIIATEGEFQAAQVLANAAEIISTQPAALALRYMQTLLDMGSNQNSTIVFPIPIELIRPLLAAPVPMVHAAPAPARGAAAPTNGAAEPNKGVTLAKS
jgi:regulator of protease activity HflC (stomatin/prohibitin superfamily)